MPLINKRLIEPTSICRAHLSTQLGDTALVAPSVGTALSPANELEGVTNCALVNIILQLSSLSKHADDIFIELFTSAETIMKRCDCLQHRVDSLAEQATQLDSGYDDVSQKDIHLRKAFRSKVVLDQAVFTRSTMPSVMLDAYNLCDCPPPLRQLNKYRDDNKDCLKFYTDPNYFFELWRQDMLKENDRLIYQKSRKPHKSKLDTTLTSIDTASLSYRSDLNADTPGQPALPSLVSPVVGRTVSSRSQRNDVTADADYHNTQANNYQMKNGPYMEHDSSPILAESNNKALPNRKHPVLKRQTPQHSLARTVSCSRPSHPPPAPPPLLPPPPPPSPPYVTSGDSRVLTASRLPLPPAPAISVELAANHTHNLPATSTLGCVIPAPDFDLPPPPLDLDAYGSQTMTVVPPPLPPILSPSFTNGHVSTMNKKHVMKYKPSHADEIDSVYKQSRDNKTPPVFDARSDLLKAIRQGIQLKKVEEVEGNRRDEASNHLADVASILARRVAIQISDSESESDIDESQSWDETSP